MAEISLLQPTVLRGIIERFTAPETLTLLNSVRQTKNPFPTASWEVTRGARNIARPNVPNSEAHIVNRLGRSAMSAAFVYLREKKVFEPTTLHWLREAASSNSELSRTNAEEAVLREVKDLNTRFDNFAEFLLWRSLTGVLNFDYEDVVANVDYGFSDTHKPTVSTKWNTATSQQILSDVRAWKSLIQTDGQVTPNVAFTSDKVINTIFDKWAGTTGDMLSDRMKDEYYGTGTLPKFLGLNWTIQDAVYDATGASYSGLSKPGDETRFLDENDIVLANLQDNSALELYVGPSADDEAPHQYTGKFAKTWKEADPSARQYLLEWNILPVILRPDQIVYVNDVVSA